MVAIGRKGERARFLADGGGRTKQRCAAIILASLAFILVVVGMLDAAEGK